MCNTVNPKNRSILNTINTHPTSAHEDFLIRHGFELSCFIQFGITAEKLNQINLELLKIHVEKEQISKDRLVEAGLHQSKIDEIFEVKGEEIGDIDYDDDDFDDVIIAPAPVPSNALIERIRNNDIAAETIRNALDSGLLTESALLNIGLSYDVVTRLSNFKIKEMSEVDVKNLPQLQPGRTDFYFLGMPSAGKTCILASLLSFWENIGSYRPDINARAIEYTDVLLEPFDSGYLPNRTSTGFLDYISCSLNVKLKKSGLFGKGQTTRSIPINVLDMAGEAWRKAAAEGSDLPDHKRYLTNNNEKAIIIVLDCLSQSSTKLQARNIVRIFEFFNKWKIWNNTTSVVVVISKADELSKSSNYEDLKIAAENFYNSSVCANLKESITQTSEEHRFELSVLPYSIGECRFGQFLMDPNFETNSLLNDSSKNLTEWILENTGGENKGGFSGLFSN